MNILKYFLNKYLLLVIFMFINVFYGCSEEKIFNYYYRDYWGGFELKNYNFNEINEFNLLKYKCFYETGKLNKVEGYYYSGELKFVDIVENNKIKQTRYFEKNGKLRIRKTLTYNDSGQLLKIRISKLETDYDYDYIEIFKYRENKVFFNSSITYGSPENNTVTKSSGYWDSEFRPRYSEVYLYRNNEILRGMHESFEYDSNKRLKYLKTYGYLEPELELTRKEYFYDQSGKLIKIASITPLYPRYKEERFDGDIWKLYSKYDEDEELELLDVKISLSSVGKIKVIKNEKHFGGGYSVEAIYEDETVLRDYNSKGQLLSESDELSLHNGFYNHDFAGRQY